MNKKVLGLVLAGFIFFTGQASAIYANEVVNSPKVQNSSVMNGWIKGENNDWNYYENGKILTEQWLKDTDKWYYFDSNGKMLCNWKEYIDGKWYIFGNDGAMVEKKGWVYLGDGRMDGLGWHWANGDGTMKSGEWLKDNGNWYYFSGDEFDWKYYAGTMYLSGSGDIDGKCYIFGEDGAMIQRKGWIKVTKDDGQFYWYYGNGDGTVKVNQWIKDGDKWYHSNNAGALYRGNAMPVDEKLYLFDESGAMVEEKGWVNVKSDLRSKDFWYYGNGDGTVKIDQWIKYNNQWYYVGTYGDMLSDTSYDINEKEYMFDKNGVCINP